MRAWAGAKKKTPRDAGAVLTISAALNEIATNLVNDAVFPALGTCRMYAIAPASAYVAEWLQSFREFPPRQKPGSFNLDRVMEAVTAGSQGETIDSRVIRSKPEVRIACSVSCASWPTSAMWLCP